MNYWLIFLIFVPLGVFVFHRGLAVPYGDNILKNIIIDLLGLNGFNSYNITWWFNKLILILYVLSPIVFIFTKTYPIVSILLVFGMQRLGLLAGTYVLYTYLMPFVIGFVWAQNSNRLTECFSCPFRWINILICLSLLVGTMWCRRKAYFITSTEWDTYLAIAIILFVLSCKPYVNIFFSFLGRHSMNIYMIHTFVYYYFWHDEIYDLGNPWLILFVVLLISLLCSIIIEGIKRLILFDKLLDNCNKIFTVKNEIR